MTTKLGDGTMGLRERKRAETRLRIERSAITAVLEYGLEGATIDAIAAGADVSPRTFFNYFDSKEAAVIGMAAVAAMADDLQQGDAPASGDVIEDLIGVIVTVFGASILQQDLHDERREVLRRYPQIGEALFRAKHELQQRLAAVVQERIPLPAAPEHRAQVADMIAGLCISAVRSAFHGADQDADGPELARAALALVRNTVAALT
ncbi:TetR/AcrR family transcriptional regulator [Curtobacterium sp. ISL-83]|uniref:TetR/AcrR family transcriptional regulator n=1 Tax=Curtobacterium sp. ISL-83 TaxID=2819145 RepID=UPI001BEC53B7|nr:TetR/AcrR family transcriptional regulator [Curtobacterium sp. ISL-83]MBT2504131.1 TetR family transcriptional regulator [Curtobacterium sp. ISL-83]